MSSCLRVSALSVLLLGIAIASPVGAVTVTLLASDSGHHSSNGNHTTSNQSYAAGWSNEELRNFFVFNLAGLPAGETIVSATLRAYNPADEEPNASFQGGYRSADPSETYELREILLPSSTVTAPSISNTTVFDHIGAGAFFGSTDVTLADNGQDVDVVLNAAGIAHLQTFFGAGDVVLGGLISTLVSVPGTEEGIWAETDPAGFGPYDRQLIITFTPEPTTGALLALGLTGLAARRRPRS